MDESTKNSPCKECDVDVAGVQLHAEVEHLRQHLAERDSHIVALEGEFLKCTARASDLEEQVDTWREKYERLYDSHIRVQKLNQILEDKLLQMVDKMKGEKSQLTKDIATLSVRLAESKHNYSMLQKENERYKNDMNLAIQLLQCKPDNFVSQKLDNLPVDTQARVSQYVMSKTSKPSSAAQSKNGNENDTFDASEYEFNISASLMTKILEDSIQDSVTKHCDTCTCNKSQSKPFCYNESYYSVATQTILGGEMRNSLCLNCNAEIKSLHSNLSIRSSSPRGIKLINDKNPNYGAISPLYIIPKKTVESHEGNSEAAIIEKSKTDYVVSNHVKPDEIIKIDKILVTDDALSKIEDEMRQLRKDSMNMEPAVHHKLCDRTQKSISSKRSSNHSVGNEDLLIKDIPNKETKPKNDSQSADNMSMRKNSQGSMGGLSRTSSAAKSTVSTHKSNTHVGPGPRFCHLRMQAGSKNILLDNAEPDVPPVLYRRQSKCNENSMFKDINDGPDNFVDLDKNNEIIQESVKNDTVVVESTLIDVHVDNNAKEPSAAVVNTPINPILLNVSSSPLQPLKTHNFSNSSEHNNNNKPPSVENQPNATEISNLLNDFNEDLKTAQNNSQVIDDPKKADVFTPTDSHDIKIFNFDRYEQNKLASQYPKPMIRKIDMSQLHSIEKTRIFKDFPPQVGMLKGDKKVDAAGKSTLPAIVNVYPNLTQTHLKVNESKQVFTNEQSTSSLSSDDSAALLQKQQLLRVAEWVEQNLEQQNNYNDPLEDEVNFSSRAVRRDSKISRLTETLNELALNMPHPVSKYSKGYTRDSHNNWVHNASTTSNQLKTVKQSTSNTKIANNIAKETIFPAECGDLPVTEINNDAFKNRSEANDFDVDKELSNAFKSNGDMDISPDDLARMEYNVKKFLLSGPHWVSSNSVGRSRRTSSKTETDV